MFGILPVEVIECILVYLNVIDIVAFCNAFNKQYSIFSNRFLKTVCLKSDLSQQYKSRGWLECFVSGINKMLGHFEQLNETPPGVVEHIYYRSVVTFIANTIENTYYVYFLDDSNKFNLYQKINVLEGNLQFKDEFIIAQKKSSSICTVILYMYNFTSNLYEPFLVLPEYNYSIFGLSKKYCTAYNTNKRCFNLYRFSDKTMEEINVPGDVQFLILKILHKDSIYVSVLTFVEGYRIRVFDLNARSWTLDLACFESTGITNDPNVWVDSNFIGCCDILYRLRAIYFGQFKMWNKEGEQIFQIDIEPSEKHYLHCLFKDNQALLTTTEKTIVIFDTLGNSVSTFDVGGRIQDIKMSTGNLLFVLLHDKQTVEVYDWKTCTLRYNIKLRSQPEKCLCSDFLFCYKYDDNDFEVIKFH